MDNCECGAQGVIQITVADREGYVLECVALCAECATHPRTWGALAELDLDTGLVRRTVGKQAV